jgi:histidinol-phosphate phosphatase family protein
MRVWDAAPEFGGGRLPCPEAASVLKRNVVDRARPLRLHFEPPATRRRRGAVFVDKDGTLVEDVPYNVNPQRLRFRVDALDALARLCQRGHRLFIVSNQPGIALGRFPVRALARLATELVERLRAAGIAVEGFYACPHAATPRSSRCQCRKPAPGLLQLAAFEHGLDLNASWMIGDILDDIEAGARAGTRTILLDVGNETEWHRSRWRIPTATVSTLTAAAEMILAADRADITAVNNGPMAWQA